MAYQGFVNLTPFAAEPLLLNDERGADVFTCVVKATFSLHGHADGTSLALADEQVPVRVAAEYNGDDPAASSVKFDAETALLKLGTDLVLIGHAHAQSARAAYVDVALSIGPVRNVVRVFGDRVWRTTMGRWSPSPPEPFEAMPLVYERAYGGWDRSHPNPANHEYEPRNPAGVGFVSRKHGVAREGSPLPNLENPYEPISSPTDRPAPAGFGFIAPHWQPRMTYAGTYDDGWKKRRMPLLPDDFDRRYYNAAHPTLALNGFLRGGEPVELVNASPRGPLRFSLPTASLVTSIKLQDGSIQRTGMVLDTVILDADEHRLNLIWRGSVPVHKRVHDIVWAKTELYGEGGAAR